MFRRIILSLICLCAVLTMSAQQRGGFDPAKFESELETFVIKEAGITQAEQGKFLQIYREKRKKELAVMKERMSRKKPTTEKDYEIAIKAYDNEDLQLKKIQQTYHNQMLRVIPASKVLKVQFAEDNFHRQQFTQHMGQRRGQPGGNRQGQRRNGQQRGGQK